MEVSGRRKVDYISCESCCEGKQKVFVVGFCVDCNEYLCSTCYEHHCNPRPCRNHVLLDKETMPRTKPDSKATNITDNGDKCSKHRGEIINIYCRADRQLGCGSCMMKDHRTCKERISIDEEYETVDKEIQNVGLQLDKNFQTKEQNSAEIEMNHSQALKDF